jgi:23S rRNA (adenine1618-N6)-methyltransferase
VLQAGVVAKINSALDALPLHWTWKPLLSMGVGAAAKNVWSRAARREAARTAESSGNSDDEDEEDGMPFVFKIHVRKISLDGDEGIEGGGDGKGGRGVEVVIRWLKGSDSVLFESFCGMLRRKVEG